MSHSSVGLVKTQYFTFGDAENPLRLKSGSNLAPVTVAYETYGKLNPKKSNAILICHALTGDAHAAGKHSSKDKKNGWWDSMIGPGKTFDTNKYYIVCSNVIGGCSGSTGPNSINPKTKKEYGISFPVVTIADMVDVQKRLLEFLDIEHLHSIAGGSMGGMQILEWAVRYPDFMDSVIVIASTSKLSSQSIAFDAVGRSAIISDPYWNNGNYYKMKKQPHHGLAIARMIGHITYLSNLSMNKKFGRRLQNKEKLSYDFSNEFQVESYLHHQGSVFVERFDANSYLYVTKAMDYFDLSEEYGSLKKAMKRLLSKMLIISFSSDWLFPPEQSEEIIKACLSVNKTVFYTKIESQYGHDAFLLETKRLTKLIKNFLNGIK